MNVTTQKVNCKDELFTELEWKDHKAALIILFTKLKKKSETVRVFNTKTVTQSRVFTEVKSMLDEH